jgi:hypothetical protein
VVLHDAITRQIQGRGHHVVLHESSPGL